MAFELICTLDALPGGRVRGFLSQDRTPLILVALPGGAVNAFQGTCPHQQIELAEGTVAGTTLTCREHWWQFDLTTGAGVNPENCRLAQFPVRIDGGNVLVDVADIVPFKAGRQN